MVGRSPKQKPQDQTRHPRPGGSHRNRQASGIVCALPIPCDPFWKFARLSGAVLDKTGSTGMLPRLARTRIRL